LPLAASAFDVLAGDGDDYRALPLSLRKLQLARLLRSRSEGIFAAPFEQGEIGPDLFRKACKLGLESKIAIVPIAAARRSTGSR
jgi:bifunctional non-homologous end joining protein LigD